MAMAPLLLLLLLLVPPSTIGSVSSVRAGVLLLDASPPPTRFTAPGEAHHAATNMDALALLDGGLSVSTVPVLDKAAATTRRDLNVGDLGKR